jgi:hypothetical protein
MRSKLIYLPFVLLAIVAVASMPILVVHADPMYTDPTDDMLTSGGFAVAVPYLDIVNYQVTVSVGQHTVNGNPDVYTVTMNMNGPIPSRVPDFVEWDLLVDSDMNALTHPAGNFWVFVARGHVGIDYIARYWMDGSKSGAELVSYDSNGFPVHMPSEVQATVNGSTVTLNIDLNPLGTVFSYLVATREYTTHSSSLTPVGFVRGDLAPDYGYNTFGVGQTTVSQYSNFGPGMPDGFVRVMKGLQHPY